VEEQMDWIGDKLAQLVEEGKRAIGREVVVMSDAKEDEVDDGADAWVEDAEEGGWPSSSASSSRRGSMRRSRPREIVHASLSVGAGFPSPSPFSSPRKSRLRHHSPEGGSEMSASLPGSSVLGSPGFLVRGLSESEREEEHVSPEVRELMERARARWREGR
jgi:hypothetical protein